MDHFSEQILKQTMDGKRILIIFGAVFAAIALCVASALFLQGMLFLPVVAMSGYGVYWVASSQSWEVEYAVTNGDIDIDRIVARRSRTCIVRVRGAKIESLRPVTAAVSTQGFARVVMAARRRQTATWYFTYQGKAGKTLVFFEPNNDVLEALKGGLSRVVAIETDRAIREM